MDFVKLTEHNEWEGEEWDFYIPYSPENQKTIDALAEIIEEKAEEDYDFPFEIDTEELIPENEVDILVKHSRSGYLMFRNKLKGVLDPKVLKGDLRETIYKGKIKNFMKKTKKKTAKKKSKKKVG